MRENVLLLSQPGAFGRIVVLALLLSAASARGGDAERLQIALDDYTASCFQVGFPYQWNFIERLTCNVRETCSCTLQNSHSYPCTLSSFRRVFGDAVIQCADLRTPELVRGPAPGDDLLPLRAPAPALGMAADGSLVLVSTGNDDGGSGILVRRFSPAGEPLGDAFIANQLTFGEQLEPDVSVLPDGSFIVVWASDFSFGADGDGRSIQQRRFGADGQPLGDQQQVNRYQRDDQGQPSVSTNAAGDWVVAWTSEEVRELSRGFSGSDESGTAIRAQSFAANGDRRGLEVQVNGITDGDQSHPSVAVAADGSYLVVWQSEVAAAFAADRLDVRGRRFDADSAPVGDEFTLNALTGLLQEQPDAAAMPGGGYRVVWQSTGSFGDDTAPGPSFSVQLRSVPATGPLGAPETQVNIIAPKHQAYPRIGVDANAMLAVTWTTFGPALPLGSARKGEAREPEPVEVRLLRLDAEGIALGDENVVAVGEDTLLFSGIAVGPRGEVVVAWEDSSDPSGSGTSFQPAPELVFADGFEERTE